MKAAVVTDFTQPLEIQDRPVPEPGPGQVLVRMEACGLCHTDIHAAHGDWPVKPAPPFVPGHEGVGIVERVGAGVTARQVGDRVAIPWLGHACGRCDHCISGWETLCEQQQNSGYSIDGAFAEYAVADAEFVVAVPEGGRPPSTPPRSPAPASRPTRRSRWPTSGPPRGWPSSASAGSVTWRCSTPAWSAASSSPSTSTTTKLRAGPVTGCRPHRQRRHQRPGRRDRGAGRGRRRGRDRRDPGRVRAGLRCAPARRPAGVRGPSARDRRPDEPADLPDGAQGHLGDRLDRRHPPGPGRGLRAARPRPDEGRRREPQARRGQRVDRRRARGRATARLVFEF